MTRLSAVVNGLWRWLVNQAPTIAAVLIVIAIGAIGAFVIRRIVRYLFQRTGLETLLERVGIARLLYAVGARRGTAHLAGQFAFAATWLLIAAIVADLLELSALSSAITIFAGYLPKLLSASAVFIAGIAGATVIRRVVRGVAARRDDLKNKSFAAEASYYVVIIISAAWAAEQAGFQTGIVTSLIKILLGMIVAGLALSVALGFRSIFHNIAARYYFEELLHPGDRVRMDQIEGIVVQFTPVSLVIRSERTDHVIPCRMLLAHPFTMERVTVDPMSRDSTSPQVQDPSSEGNSS